MSLVDVAQASVLPQAFAQIDWERPWLAELREVGEPVAARILRGASVAEALNAASRCADFEFVDQHALPPGMAYERFIFENRRIPTRDSLHDFFNGLIWLHFPRTKRLLNQWQAREIAAQGVGAVRGPLRDAITVFDENGALLFAPQPLREALRHREWRRLGEELRPLWRQSRLVPVGHALLEKLVSPRKNITAHVFLPEGGVDPGADTNLNLNLNINLNVDADAWMARHFEARAFATKPFNPLPVLGVPGWWSENENFCFYDDSDVFRSGFQKNIQQ
ncbi:DUF3025 domain-containing protein [Diaphorobacter caeni]|uniref:DUF3025 domain-containing protein n=1 Tax=Diaphorobacter caeni TaxID=2784387 RepID=UPI00188F751A|nr:DUF3025 domain-containing protein [Diaphorobacter caeni]MBF5004110.1 DUF3025 domain-containing protein [Diaphorobacter caeni]